MLHRLVVRICSVLLSLCGYYFWVWERHLSGAVASGLEECVHGHCDRVNITTGMPCWTKLSICKARCKCCWDSRIFGGSFHHGPCKFFGQKWQHVMKLWSSFVFMQGKFMSFYLCGVFSLMVLVGTQDQDCYLKICEVSNLQPANRIYRPAHRVYINNVYDMQCFLLQVCLP